ncbi:hypothetical protein OSB04_026125 [Centaurea solstitialis]|uniref:Uncharacterized protein n=1 Tax=Centaurea solstitialis TaxID=347529 RepID=A0AA38SCJ5_9ASTR|nr:hypothetical protein OSB04_026125 [Centaurea solstitialis]
MARRGLRLVSHATLCLRHAMGKKLIVMEKSKNLGKDSPEVLQSQTRFADEHQILGFDDDDTKQNHSNFQFMDLNGNDIETPTDSSNQQPSQSVSISMPSQGASKDEVEASGNDSLENPGSVKFHSGPTMMSPETDDQTVAGKTPDHRLILPVKTTRMDEFKDSRYNSFKTWSGRLERQLSTLRGKSRNEPEINAQNLDGETLTLSVDRYFDALEGPELETLKPLEEIMLPADKKWPFLLRYPISSFGICLGVSSQAIMWKNLASTASTHFLHISLRVNYALWCISILLFAVVFATYLLKVIFYFEAVRREYYHPIRVNFFFAPWIALLFLAIGVPDSVATELPHSLWYVLMTPIFCLELKIYGQWMSGGQRRLSKVANPSNHLSVVGNFVGALLGASMGLKEGPIFFFAVGLAHYTVLFVTLYQRLPTNETLRKSFIPCSFCLLRPRVLLRWRGPKLTGHSITGLDSPTSLRCFSIFHWLDHLHPCNSFTFLIVPYQLLQSSFTRIIHAVRVNFFRGFKFSLAWWAYTFPMTGAAISTIRYSSEVPNVVTKGLSLVLSIVATVTVTGLLITTILHAFVLRDLFPNDIGIAISDQKPKTKTQRKWFHRGTCGSAKDTERQHKTRDSDEKEVRIPGSVVKPITVRIQ